MTANEQKDSQGLSINRDVMFSNHKGVYKKGLEKRQTRLLQKVSFIKPFLAEDEEIHLVSTGCSPITVLEQLLMGWIVFYVKRSLFVFTNKRVFHIPSKTDFSYKNSVAQMAYADCKSIKLKGRSLVVEYADGKKEKFYYMAARERKKIKAMFTGMSFSDYQAKTEKRVHLCPRCTEKLEENRYDCPNCQLEFKNKEKARKISILFPGGGYFYTGHPFLGLGDALAETALIVLLVAAIADALNQSVYEGVIFIAVLLMIEKAVSIYDSNKFVDEYIPLDTEVRTIAR